MPVSKLSDTNFESYMLEATLPVLVDFTAEWCRPCRQLAPLVEQLADELVAQLQVGRLDIDQNLEITMQYGILSVPTLILFKNGKPVERLVGMAPKAKILERLRKHIDR